MIKEVIRARVEDNLVVEGNPLAANPVRPELVEGQA